MRGPGSLQVLVRLRRAVYRQTVRLPWNGASRASAQCRLPWRAAAAPSRFPPLAAAASPPAPDRFEAIQHTYACCCPDDAAEVALLLTVVALSGAVANAALAGACTTALLVAALTVAAVTVAAAAGALH